VRRLSRRYIKVLLELLQKRPVQEMFVMMSEEEVRSLLATLQEIDRMKIANTDAAIGVLLIVLGEDLPSTKK
jgi:nitrate reductase NapAB chaperone NapD